ncbi:MAG TPA: hypothetical protein VJA19_05215 [Pseudomonas sp.]|nr:hypothetical protein [Pseudomonas sp.]
MSVILLGTVGQLFVWGANNLGQAGQGPGPDLALPVAVAGLASVQAISVNAATMLALDGNGQVWSWGWNQSGLAGRAAVGEKLIWLPTALRARGHALTLGAAGNPDEESERAAFLSLEPEMIPGLPAMRQVLLAHDQAFALEESGRVWTWGGPPACDRQGRQLPAALPRRLAGLEGIRQISAAPDGFAAYKSMGSESLIFNAVNGDRTTERLSGSVPG